MNCKLIVENLEMFMLGELGTEPAAQLAAHLAACPGCRARATEYRLLVGQIKQAARPARPSQEFERALRRAVVARIAAQRRRWQLWRALQAVGSIAALLLGSTVAIWALYDIGRHDPDRTVGRTSARGSAEPAKATNAARSTSERWRFAGAWAASDSLADEVIVHDGTLYLLRDGSDGARVAAVDALTGQLSWQSQQQAAGYLAADASRVYCLAAPSSGGVQLAALDASNGSTLWQYGPVDRGWVGGMSRAVPLAGDRVCWSYGDTVHLLDAKTGTLLWARRLAGERQLSSPVIKGENVYVASCNALYCLQLDSGQEAWSGRFADEQVRPGHSLLAAADRRIYVARNPIGLRTELICMELGTRRQIWRRSVPRVRSLLAAGDTVWLRAEQVMALDGCTGERLWSYVAGGCGPLTLDGNLIYFVDSRDEGRLIALEGNTGKLAWSIPGLRSCDAFVKVGSTGYVKTRDGVVHVFALLNCGRS